jgi:hypothetical protein
VWFGITQSTNNRLNILPFCLFILFANILGSLFQTDEKYKTIANLFVDFFRGEVATFVNLKGTDKVISISTCENTNKILFRCVLFVVNLLSFVFCLML